MHEHDEDQTDAPTHERTKSRRVGLAVVLPALILTGLLAWGFLAPGSKPPRQVPAFSLRLLGGGTLTSADLRGDPVVLNYWASWCVPCREEMPLFERMHRRYEERGVHIIGVNFQDSVEGAQGFVDEIGVTYPIALDTQGTLASELGVRGLPQTFFIDRNFRFEKLSAGEAVEGAGDRVVFGAIDEDTLEAKIEELLED